jgi:hypothetical protein
MTDPDTLTSLDLLLFVVAAIVVIGLLWWKA